jgi:hypothetical protein
LARGVLSRQLLMSRGRNVALIAGLAALIAVGSYLGYARPWQRAAGQLGASVATVPSAPRLPPGMVADPLLDGRPMQIDESRAELPDDWVEARPKFQASRSAAERGGVEPCATQPVDDSGFSPWAPLGRGRYTLPLKDPVSESGDFELVIHLHGQEPVLRELVESQQRFALYTLTLPPQEGYAPLFSGTQLYRRIITDMERVVSERAGKPAHAKRVVLSAWSAGFVGIAAVLAQPDSTDVQAVVLIDGLHAPRSARQAFEAQLQPFVDFAKRAATSQAFIFVSHSSIDPPDFASTTECAHYLIAALGGRPRAVKRSDALGLELVESFTQGDFHVRGYAGNDKPDHCAQLGLLRDVYRVLGERWARR